MSSADDIVTVGMNATNLEKRSTIVNTVSWPRCVIGSDVIKSIVTSSNGFVAGGRGYNNPGGDCVDTFDL